MEVANPIYDVVFKHLMQSDRVARLLVGQIAGFDVQSLELRPQEVAIPRDGTADRLPLTVIRMDFAARVRTADGRLRQVLIEIQKAKTPTVVGRFRRYLGERLRDGDSPLAPDPGVSMAVPIVAIYFLGYDLGLSDEPVIDVCPDVRERRTGRRLDAGHPFVSSLRHRSRVIQIPRLAKRRRDDLERFLSIFDQAQAAGDRHVLRIEEEDYPQQWAFVLRRLRAAMAEENVRRSMEGEDELLRDSIMLAQQAEAQRQRADEANQRAEAQRQRADEANQRAEAQRQQADEANQRAEAQQQQADEANRQAEAQRQRADEANQRAEQTLARSVRQLHRLGQDAAEIAAALSIDIAAVRRILSA